MDNAAVLSAWVSLLWWLIPLLIGSAVLNSAWFKGKIGEWSVNRALTKHLDRQDYTVLRDLTLPLRDGTTQIDHIVLSRFGLFILETKHYSGWIFGHPQSRTWTQVLYRKKFRFQNPLRQNSKHIRAVSEVLGVPLTELHSVILFTGSARFQTPMPDNVTTRAGGIRYIRRWKTPVYTAEQVTAFTDALLQSRLPPGMKTHWVHLSNLHKAANAQMCPKCGSELVLRNAKRGPLSGSRFWGCQNFPRCRYTQAMDT